MQISVFHLAGIYELFISILRNMVGLRVKFVAPLTGLNSPVVFVATAHSKAEPPIFHLCFLSILYAYCTFASCTELILQHKKHLPP